MNPIRSVCRRPGVRRFCALPALSLCILLLSVAAQAQTGPAFPGDNGEVQDELRYLREEIRRLQAAIGENQKLINQLRQQQLDQYLELERRLLQLDARLEGVEAPVAEPAPEASETDQADEYREFQEARNLLNAGKLPEALSAFREFLSHWPQGKHAADAWFWTGELHLQQRPPELEDARRAFAAILAHFPGHSREPNAMFKLGKVYHLQGKLEQAEQTLRQLVERYESASHSAARLAEGYLQQYF